MEIEIALPMAPRLPTDIALNKYTAHKAELDKLEASFTDLRSISWSIQNANHATSQTSCSGDLYNPIMTLLRIVEHDTRIFPAESGMGVGRYLQSFSR